MKNLYLFKKAIKYIWLVGVILFLYCNRDKESCERQVAREVDSGGVVEINKINNKISVLENKNKQLKNNIIKNNKQITNLEHELIKMKIKSKELEIEKDKKQIRKEEQKLKQQAATIINQSKLSTTNDDTDNENRVDNELILLKKKYIALVKNLDIELKKIDTPELLDDFINGKGDYYYRNETFFEDEEINIFDKVEKYNTSKKNMEYIKREFGIPKKSIVEYNIKNKKARLK